jgi:hypothetical protein
VRQILPSVSKELVPRLSRQEVQDRLNNPAFKNYCIYDFVPVLLSRCDLEKTRADPHHVVDRDMFSDKLQRKWAKRHPSSDKERRKFEAWYTKKQAEVARKKRDEANGVAPPPSFRDRATGHVKRLLWWR